MCARRREKINCTGINYVTAEFCERAEWGNIRTTVIDGKIRKVRADGEIVERERCM